MEFVKLEKLIVMFFITQVINETESDGSLSSYNLTWFFSVSGWNNNDGLNNKIPVRATMRGFNVSPNGTRVRISQLFDISNFYPFLLIPNPFDIPPSANCIINPYNTYIFSFWKLAMNPLLFDQISYVNTLSSALSIGTWTIDVVDVLKYYDSTGWHTVVITIFETNTQTQSALNESLGVIVAALPTQLNNIAVNQITFTTSLDCSNSCQGSCHFGFCACNYGFSGVNCDDVLMTKFTGYSDIVISMDFGNFAGTAFIIGFCFFFVGLVIGYSIFKWRYKQVHRNK